MVPGLRDGQTAGRGLRGGCRQSASTTSTMCSAIASDDVAPGEGALRTAVTGPSRSIRKSSTSEPSGSSACARTPAPAPDEVGPSQLRHVPARLGQRTRAWTATRAARARPSASAAARARRKPRPAERLRDVARPHVAPAVALAGERQHGVRADVDPTVDPAREVHAEERVGGVGHGVDEPAHEVPPLRGEAVVLAAERHDRRSRVVARASRATPVGLQPGADDEPVEVEFLAARRHAHGRPVSPRTASTSAPRRTSAARCLPRRRRSARATAR